MTVKFSGLTFCVVFVLSDARDKMGNVVIETGGGIDDNETIFRISKPV